jgi:hypothetical protein
VASHFPAFIAHHQRDPLVVPYTVDAAATFVAGALVFLNTSDNEIEECGADPANILGIALMPASAKTLYDGKVLVAVLDPDMVIGMASATTPADSHLTDAYGVVKGTTHWLVDTSETSNTRIHVIKVDATNGIFFVKFMAATLQGDAIAS